MAEVKKKPEAKAESAANAAPKQSTTAKPKAAPKPKTAPKSAASTARQPAKPKAAPKAETRKASAPKASSEQKQSASGAPGQAASAAQMPADWAKMIVNQLIEAQKMWLEMTTQQTALVVKTVSEVMGMSQSAPTEALGNWAKQGVESFIEAQRQWSEIAMQQSAQLMQTVQSGASFGGGGGAEALGNFQAAAGKGLETLVGLRSAWLDFAEQQNAQMVKALKQNLKLDDASPVAALADFAQATMSSYVEIQKRWLDLATQMPLFGGALNKEKK